MRDLLEQISQSDNGVLTFAKKTYTKLTNFNTMSECRQKGKKVYLLLTPQYNNLGDHAIALSALAFLKKHYSDYLIVEITSNFYKNFNKRFKRYVNTQDLLFIIGGGFMGDLWGNLESLTRDIIKSFPKNKIVVLPQTIYYKSAENIPEAKSIYCAHDNLHVIAREQNTYNLCKNVFGLKRCYLLPDIVTICDLNVTVEKENVVGFCFRNDIERGKINMTKEEIAEAVKAFDKCMLQEITTLSKKAFISTAQRKRYVYDKIRQIGKCKLLITNRLHAMLFAYVSGTPCIAIDNVSNKVSGTYQWISECDYIKLYNGKEPFEKLIEELGNKDNVKKKNEMTDKLLETYKDVFYRIDRYTE